MDKTEAGERCRKYLEDKLPNINNLIFWPHKSMIQIEDRIKKNYIIKNEKTI